MANEIDAVQVIPPDVPEDGIREYGAIPPDNGGLLSPVAAAGNAGGRQQQQQQRTTRNIIAPDAEEDDDDPDDDDYSDDYSGTGSMLVPRDPPGCSFTPPASQRPGQSPGRLTSANGSIRNSSSYATPASKPSKRSKRSKRSYGLRSLRRNSTGSSTVSSASSRLLSPGGQSPSIQTPENGGSLGDLSTEIVEFVELDDDAIDAMSPEELKEAVRKLRTELRRIKAEFAANWIGGSTQSPIFTPDSLRRARNISPTDKSWASWADDSCLGGGGFANDKVQAEMELESARKSLTGRLEASREDGDSVRSGDGGGWQAFWRADGNIYYCHSGRDESSWTAPAGSQTWVERTNAKGETYYDMFLSQDDPPADGPLVFVLDENKNSDGETDGGDRSTRRNGTDPIVGWTAFWKADGSICYRKTDETEDKMYSVAPEGSQTWRCCTDDEGNIHYEMVKSQSERPASDPLIFVLEEDELRKVREEEAAGTNDVEDRSPEKAPPGWSKYRDEDGLSYYHNPKTGETVWDRPSEEEKEEKVAADAVAVETAEMPTAATSGRPELESFDNADSISSIVDAGNDDDSSYDGNEDAGVVKEAKKKGKASKKEVAVTIVKPDHVVEMQEQLVGNDEAEEKEKENAGSGDTNALDELDSNELEDQLHVRTPGCGNDTNLIDQTDVGDVGNSTSMLARIVSERGAHSKDAKNFQKLAGYVSQMIGNRSLSDDLLFSEEDLNSALPWIDGVLAKANACLSSDVNHRYSVVSAAILKGFAKAVEKSMMKTADINKCSSNFLALYKLQQQYTEANIAKTTQDLARIKKTAKALETDFIGVDCNLDSMFKRCGEDKSERSDVDPSEENGSEEDDDQLASALCIVEEIERAAREAGIEPGDMHKQLGLRASKNVLKLAITLKIVSGTMMASGPIRVLKFSSADVKTLESLAKSLNIDGFCYDSTKWTAADLWDKIVARALYNQHNATMKRNAEHIAVALFVSLADPTNDDVKNTMSAVAGSKPFEEGPSSETSTSLYDGDSGREKMMEQVRVAAVIFLSKHIQPSISVHCGDVIGSLDVLVLSIRSSFSAVKMFASVFWPGQKGANIFARDSKKHTFKLHSLCSNFNALVGGAFKKGPGGSWDRSVEFSNEKKLVVRNTLEYVELLRYFLIHEEVRASEE